jgi:hypothetical protein
MIVFVKKKALQDYLHWRVPTRQAWTCKGTLWGCGHFHWKKAHQH